MAEPEIVVGGFCRPNFSGAGRRRRQWAAVAAAVLSVLTLAALILLDAGWPVRLLLGLPVGGAVVAALQVRRNTCVAHAATGVFENEDLSTTKVEDAIAAESRRVAATIWRDGILAAALAASLGAASAWLR
jgi:hypothetical protein